MQMLALAYAISINDTNEVSTKLCDNTATTDRCAPSPHNVLTRLRIELAVARWCMMVNTSLIWHFELIAIELLSDVACAL
jgi:hypothetical protein